MTACSCCCWRKERSHGQYCLACCSCAIWDIYVVNFPYTKSRLLHSQNLASWCWLQWYTRLNLKYAAINSYLVNWLSQNLKLWLISSCCQNTGSVNCNTAAVANARSEWVTPVHHHRNDWDIIESRFLKDHLAWGIAPRPNHYIGLIRFWMSPDVIMPS